LAGVPPAGHRRQAVLRVEPLGRSVEVPDGDDDVVDGEHRRKIDVPFRVVASSAPLLASATFGS
jgi:hypothetical protein